MHLWGHAGGGSHCQLRWDEQQGHEEGSQQLGWLKHCCWQIQAATGARPSFETYIRAVHRTAAGGYLKYHSEFLELPRRTKVASAFDTASDTLRQ